MKDPENFSTARVPCIKTECKKWSDESPCIHLTIIENQPTHLHLIFRNSILSHNRAHDRPITRCGYVTFKQGNLLPGPAHQGTSVQGDSE
jgi:hypothetical protein